MWNKKLPRVRNKISPENRSIQKFPWGVCMWLHVSSLIRFVSGILVSIKGHFLRLFLYPHFEILPCHGFPFSLWLCFVPRSSHWCCWEYFSSCIWLGHPCEPSLLWVWATAEGCRGSIRWDSQVARTLESNHAGIWREDARVICMSFWLVVGFPWLTDPS